MGWTEEPRSRSIKMGPTSGSRTDRYFGRGFTDSDEAYIELVLTAPAFVVSGKRILGGPEYSVEPVVNPTDPNVSVYAGSVTYKTPDLQQPTQQQEPQVPGDPSRFTFDFSSIEDVRTEAIEQTTYFPDDLGGTNRPNWTKAINQQHPELPPEGVQVNKPIANFTVNTVLHSSVADAAWWKEQMDQVWTLNEAEFRTLPPKCVALTGIGGELRSDGFFHVQYNFEYRPMQPAAVLEGTGNEFINIPELPGWTYLWAQYKTFETVNDADPTKPPETRRVLSKVHVADIYPTSDFNKLAVIEE